MTANAYSTHGIWNGVTTEQVTFADLKPGDAVWIPGQTAGPDPVRVRVVDKYPGGRVAIFAASASDVEHLYGNPYGLFLAATPVTRVVL